MVSNDHEISKALPQSDMTENSLAVNLDLHHATLHTALGVLSILRTMLLKSVQKSLPSTKRAFVAHEPRPDDLRSRWLKWFKTLRYMLLVKLQ